MAALFQNLQEKAQQAINASPLAGHIPGTARASSPDGQPSANQAAATGGSRNYTLESLQHQIRLFGQQYSSSTTPAQRIITIEKGIALDFESVSRDAKSQSKDLYTWGQTEAEDVKDVSDRLAYLNFVQGSLAASLSQKLDSARTPLKTLRDAEAALQPKRNIRAGLQNQIARLEHDQAKGMEKKLHDLKEQLKRAESEDSSQENEVEILKRKALYDSEQQKWEALREFGEKLVLLSQASASVVSALPSIPPSTSSPYTGAQATATARASLQRALDNYRTGQINFPASDGASDLSRSDTRSFGVTHATELSSISDATEQRSSLNVTPPASARPHGVQLHDPPSAQVSTQPPPSAYKGNNSSLAPTSPILDPSALNNAPALIPVPVPGGAPSTTAVPVEPLTGSTNAVPAVTPTVAETGVPVAADDKGPGPASGSLKDIKAASPYAGPRSGGLPGNRSNEAFGQRHGTIKYETAEQEKQRLQREERERLLTGPTQRPSASAPSTSVPTTHESAEDEKKRLEREERERVLNSSNSQGGSTDLSRSGTQSSVKGDEDLPAYQEM